MSDNKGQISLEAVMMMGILMIVLINFTSLNWASYHTARDIGETGEVRMIGELLANAIDNAHANGEGYSIHLGEDKINFTEASNRSTITGLSMALPIVVDTDDQTINISRYLRTSNNSDWITTIRIITKNIARQDPTASYPEVTILNNGSYIIIYADSSHIDVRT